MERNRPMLPCVYFMLLVKELVSCISLWLNIPSKQLLHIHMCTIQLTSRKSILQEKVSLKLLLP